MKRPHIMLHAGRRGLLRFISTAEKKCTLTLRSEQSIYVTLKRVMLSVVIVTNSRLLRPQPHYGTAGEVHETSEHLSPSAACVRVRSVLPAAVHVRTG